VQLIITRITFYVEMCNNLIVFECNHHRSSLDVW